MSRYDNVEGIVKRTMVLFFIVDKSGSMAGTKIGAVNVAIKEVIPEIQQLSEENADANIKIAALLFSSGAEWMYPSPVDVKNFKWKDINVDGLTDMGYAFKLLNEKLSRKGGFMDEIAGSYAPALFLMSDGQPTDEYKKALNDLKGNNWFDASLKAAVAIGDDADRDMLVEFAGHTERVLIAHTPDILKSIIKFVSITASKIGSTSSKVPINDKDQDNQDHFTGELIHFNDSLLDDNQDNW